MTWLFVSTAQEEKDAPSGARRVADRKEVLAELRRIEERLAALESKLE